MKTDSVLASIIVPVFNEEKTVLKILKKLSKLKRNFSIEIIVIDDGSKDNTYNILLDNKHLIDKLERNEKNSGKGFSVKKE